MNQPLISIIIPAYNTEKYILKAINSTLSQTYKNLEIWLLDDASTDGTRTIINSINDNRIKRYFVDVNTKKIGIVNEVLKLVSGDFVCFQDSDDWSELNRVEEQHKMMQQNIDLGVVFTNIVFHNNDDNIIHVTYDIPLEDNDIKNLFNDDHKQYEGGIAWATMMVKRDILVDIGGYHPYFTGKVGEDIFLVYQILKKTKAMCLKEPLYHVLRRQDSLTELQFSYKNIKAIYSWKIIKKIIEYDQGNINLLDNNNELELKKIELECCEKEFIESVERFNNLIMQVKHSHSYRLGNVLLKPLSWIKKYSKKLNF